MADFNRWERGVRRRELSSLRQDVEALRDAARGHKEDYHLRRGYARVLKAIDAKLEELRDDPIATD